jgi:hypothetical protein
MGMRIKYRNLWLVNFLQPELKFQKAEDRIRPRIACMREGGFVRVPGYIPLCAVVLSFFWIGVLLVGVWVFNVIPDEVQEQILASIGRTASS